MNRLVIEEDVGIECFQDLALLDTAQEEGFVNPDVPCPQGSDNAFMGWCAPCCNKSGPDGAGILRVAVLDNGDCLQQLGKRSFRKRLLGVLTFMFREGFQALLLIDPLRFVREEDCISVKGDPDLGIFLRGIDWGIRADQPGGDPSGQASRTSASLAERNRSVRKGVR